MMSSSFWVTVTSIFWAFISLRWFLKRVNCWVYETKLGDVRFSLPPGDMGWPFIGNMWAFLSAFKSSEPDSFINSFVSRFGKTGIYKAFMFGNPSVIVTMPETCKRVLTDDEAFKPGWPTATMELIGRKSFIGISDEEHKRLRRLTAAPVNGHEALSVYLNAGHESSGHTMMWAAIYLQQHPEFLEKAKAEQERFLTNRPPTQKGLTLKEIREMQYLSQVIDETQRLLTFSLTVFREAKRDVNISGYTIPKGWKVLVWFRTVHHDPEIYPNPMQFNPSRWNGFIPKAGSFLPFGAGSRLCPGNDLAKLEIAVFLHHFLLNYKMERLNPGSPLKYLPHTRPKDNCRALIKKCP